MQAKPRKVIGWTLFSVLCLGQVIGASTLPTKMSGFQVTKAIGRVQVMGPQSTSWLKIGQGMVLLPGQTLKTGADSYAEITFPSGTVELYENSLVKVPGTQGKGQWTRRDDESITGFLLTQGHAFIKIVRDRLMGRFEIETPSLIAGVKGTIFNVIEEKGLKGVFVSEGIVRVSNVYFPREVLEIVANQYTIVQDHHLGEVQEFKSDIKEILDLRKQPERGRHPIQPTQELRETFQSDSLESSDLHEEGGSPINEDLRHEHADLREDIRNEHADLKEDIRNEHADLKEDIRNEHADLKEDIRNEHADLKEDIQNEHADLKEDIRNEHADLKEDIRNEHANLKE